MERRRFETDREYGPTGPMQLAWAQWIATVGGLSMALLAIPAVLYEDTYGEFLARVAIPTYQQDYGFEWGLLPVRWPSGHNSYVWGIVRVVPGGEFERQGVKEGDVPFGFHNGILEMHAALACNYSGHATSLDVINADEIRGGRSDTREIVLPVRAGRGRQTNRETR
jgi:hypothetical protein